MDRAAAVPCPYLWEQHVGDAQLPVPVVHRADDLDLRPLSFGPPGGIAEHPQMGRGVGESVGSLDQPRRDRPWWSVLSQNQCGQVTVVEGQPVDDVRGDCRDAVQPGPPQRHRSVRPLGVIQRQAESRGDHVGAGDHLAGADQTPSPAGEPLPSCTAARVPRPERRHQAPSPRPSASLRSASARDAPPLISATVVRPLPYVPEARGSLGRQCQNVEVADGAAPVGSAARPPPPGRWAVAGFVPRMPWSSGRG